MRNLPPSLWAATAETVPKTDKLQNDIHVDVAVIGAGFNGLRSALVLREAGLNVAVVDAGDIGWGASGRNGGQVNPIGHESPLAIENKWLQEQGAGFGERYAKMTIQSADELFALVKKHEIQCDAEQHGWIRAMHSHRCQRAFAEMYEGWREAGADLKLIDQQELTALSGTQGYIGGWVAGNAGAVHPLSYVRGLAKAALFAGAAIYTHSLVHTLSRTTGKWRLESENGSVTADKAILSTNAYTDKLCHGLQQSIVPLNVVQGATKPLTEEQCQQVLPQRHTFADTRRVIFYFRKTADNRLVFGSVGSDDEKPTTSDRERILKGLKTVYPHIPLELDYLWGGKIAITKDHLPHIHQPAPGLYTGLGCNGRGVAMSTVMGRLLAELVLGKSEAEMPIPVTKIKKYPFHRFHHTGIKIVVPWKEFLDRREMSKN